MISRSLHAIELAATRVSLGEGTQSERCSRVNDRCQGKELQFGWGNRVFNEKQRGANVMSTRIGSAIWEGTLKDGKGTMKLGSGAFEGSYSFASRFEDGMGTNPEELIGAAEAGCFSMALSLGLTKAGYPPKLISTIAKVHIENVGDGFKITSIDLTTEAQVPSIDEKTLIEQAEATKKNCPVSQALAGTQINLQAKLVQAAS